MHKTRAEVNSSNGLGRAMGGSRQYHHGVASGIRNPKQIEKTEELKCSKLPSRGRFEHS